MAARVVSRLSALAGQTSVRSNAHRASIGAPTRKNYLRRYMVDLVLPNGSTIPIRSSEPAGMIALPVDFSKLSDDERRRLLAARKPKAKKIQQEMIDDNFDASAYVSSFYDAAPTQSVDLPKEKPTSEHKQKPAKKEKKKKAAKA